MQKRMVRKLDLERAISKMAPHPAPKAYLEQYTIPPEVASEILYMATYVYGDIIDKRVADLGCGTGRLGIGAALLGAREVIGVDIDKVAIKTAQMNAEKMDVENKTHWVIADINAIRGSFDTVLQNPPFGVQRRRADRRFIEKSLEIGRRIYSLHKSEISSRELVRRLKNRGAPIPTAPSPFLKKFIEKHGGTILAVYAMVMTIPKIFKFHTKRKYEFIVKLYILESSEART